ncbi:hypothetical protein Vadar_007576 [Vaccinium darrowii]|uniref:Uncharacterized protein n=1 Tax=Vaccinium darrowii TaxID=229202 RepID=A0ACB7XP84_9ERIC|nr:hypothetical protein Vadar_007576 [Vaccinium darrowii]
MAKAVALIAFALVVLALAGNVQAHVKKDVDQKNNSSLGVYGSVFCVTCNNGTENDWKPLGKAKVELVCKSPENGTVTFTSHGSVNDSGIYNLYMEPGHQHDLCKVHVVSSSDPLCHVKVPGFQSTSVHFKNGTESKGQVLIGFVNKESLHNCRKIKGRGGKLVPTVYSDMTLGEANLI